MIKRLPAIILTVIICAVAVLSAAANPKGALWVIKGELPAERFLKENLPFRQQLSSYVMAIKRLGGQREINGLFFSSGGLMENYSPVDEFTNYNINIKSITEVSSAGVPTYLMLIPTACAIKQQETPKYAPVFNQKRFIEECYRNLAGNATAIDVYTPLFANRDKYIYYRTDSNPTSLGGFIMYQTAAARMNLMPKNSQQFTTQYAYHDYMGNLSEKWKLGGLKPDLLSLYNFDSPNKAYTVSHFSQGENTVYNTLYPTHYVELGEPFKVFLGGIGPRVEITSNSGDRSARLLVIGDRTAAAYLPFLATHFVSITFIQPSELSAEELDGINVNNYEQVLFAYSLDNFIDYPVCAGAEKIVKE